MQPFLLKKANKFPVCISHPISIVTNEPDPSLWKKFSGRKKAAVITTALVLISGCIVAAIILSTLLNGQSKRIGDGDDSRYNIPIESTIGRNAIATSSFQSYYSLFSEKDQTSTGSVLRLIPRPTWIAQPPNAPATELELPVKRVIIAHTATGNCTTQVFIYSLSLHDIPTNRSQ